MKKISLLNMDAFKIADNETGEIFYGCSQDWYAAKWQRISGCGPSVASSILAYRERAVSGRIFDKTAAAVLMEEVWKYVTPTRRGIPTAEMFARRVESYARANGMKISCQVCEVPPEKTRRPSMDEVASFVCGAIDGGFPVAFLNLCNGDEQNLDDWHWMTIAGLERRESDGRFAASILDRGRLLLADISLWLETTRDGGGFVHFILT